MKEQSVPTQRAREAASWRLTGIVTPGRKKPGRGEKQAALQLDRKRSRELLHTRWRCCSAVRTAVTRETPASFGFELKSYILRDLSTALCSLSEVPPPLLPRDALFLKR